MERKLIKFERNEHSISFKVHSKEKYNKDKANKQGLKWEFKANSGSSNFYISNEKLKRLDLDNHVICNDIYSFCELTKNEASNTITFRITWLDSDCKKKLSGEVETFDIECNYFLLWFLFSSEKHLTLIDKKTIYRTQIIFNSNKNLRAVLADRIIRNKFIKRIMPMQDRRETQMIISDDFMDKSFYFYRSSGEQFSGNGGIILHKNTPETKTYFHKSKADSSKVYHVEHLQTTSEACYYGIHT